MIVPLVGSTSLMIVRESVVFPQPDSPTRPSVSPAFERQVDAVDRVDVTDRALEQAGADREVLDEILDAEDLLALSARDARSLSSCSAALTTHHLRRPARRTSSAPDQLLREVARGAVILAGVGRPQRRHLVAAHAPPLREEAAGMERAARTAG